MFDVSNLQETLRLLQNFWGNEMDRIWSNFVDNLVALQILLYPDPESTQL